LESPVGVKLRGEAECSERGLVDRISLDRKFSSAIRCIDHIPMFDSINLDNSKVIMFDSQRAFKKIFSVTRNKYKKLTFQKDVFMGFLKT
jgi:hypothetical protein